MEYEIETVSMPPEETVRTPEERGIRTMYSDIDREVVRRLEERYGKAVPAERIGNLHDLPPVFESRPEFDRSYKNANGTPPPAGYQVEGFVRPNLHESPHIATDQELEQLIVTDAHERMHELSDPKAKHNLGDSLYEGMTEHLARDIVGPLGKGHCYEQETAMAEKLENIAGRDVVENAYLTGNMETLTAKVDASLGKGSLGAFGAEVKGWEDLPRIDPLDDANET